MIDKEDAATIVRIGGIILSVASAVVMFIKPFEPVTNTLVVYFVLIAAAILVMIGQAITIRLNITGEFSNDLKRREAVYDVVSIGVVMVLFAVFYVVPFLTKNTTMLG